MAASVVLTAVALRFPTRLVSTGGNELGSRRASRDGVAFLDRLAALEPEANASLSRTVASLNRGTQGDAAIVITGAASDEDLEAVSGLCRRFRSVMLISFRVDARRRSTPPLAGVVTLDALTAVEAVGLWNRVVRR